MFYGRVGKKYRIPNSELSTGESGMMEVRVGTESDVAAAQRTVGYTPDKQPFNALDVEEEMSNVKGEKTEIVVIPYDYLDDWEYEIEVMTETLYQRGKSLDMAIEAEKLTAVTTMFPEIFMANRGKFFGKLMRRRSP